MKHGYNHPRHGLSLWGAAAVLAGLAATACSNVDINSGAGGTGGTGGTSTTGGSGGTSTTGGAGGTTAGAAGTTAGAAGTTAGAGGTTGGAAGTSGGAAGTTTGGAAGTSGGAAGKAGGAAGSAAVPVPVGIACTKQSECGDNGVCLGGSQFPGGYCSESCTGEVVTEGDPCPTNSTCVQVSEASAVCLADCDTKNPCRANYACQTTSDGKTSVCIPACTSDEDCGSKSKCTSDGLCVDDPTKLGQPGDSCTADASCQGDYCFTNVAYPDGLCSATCDAGTVGTQCSGTGNGNCFAVDSGAPTPDYLCFERCSTSVDCRGGYICTADAGDAFKADDGTGGCVPSCKSFPCGDGFVCDPTGVCVADKPNVAFSVSKTDLGSLTFANDQDFHEVSFDLPADTISFTVVGDPANPVQLLTPVKVTAPDGSTLFDLFDPLATNYKVKGGAYVPFGALYPNTPRLSLQPGKYTFTMGSSDPTTAKMDVIFKTGSGILDNGTLPMVFFFTENNTLNAASAKTDTVFQTAVKNVQSIYASVGITCTIDDSSYIDLPNSASLAVIDTRAELGDLFASAKGQNKAGLSYFFIDQYAFENGGNVLGISGGIPGAPGLLGTAHAGVSVAFAIAKDDPAVLTTVMAHEGGHYLGLFHPTESTGTSFDPLLDTPECPASSYDTNGDGKVSPSECASGGGAENVMFWAVGGQSQVTLTEDQKFVLMRNSLVSN
jgi:hypothetical protein